MLVYFECFNSVLIAHACLRRLFQWGRVYLHLTYNNIYICYRVFSGPYFLVFELNTGKYGPEKNSVSGHFSRSCISHNSQLFLWIFLMLCHAPCKYTTCIPCWNDVVTVNTHGVFVGHLMIKVNNYFKMKLYPEGYQNFQ